MENCLLTRINSGGSGSPIRSRCAPTKAAIAKQLQGGIEYVLRESSYVMSVMQLMSLMLIPTNLMKIQSLGGLVEDGL